MLDEIKVQEIINKISYKTWIVGCEWNEGNNFFTVRPIFRRQNSITGEWAYCKNMRPYVVEFWRSEEYLVQTIFMMFKAAEEHEVRENFRYNGKALYSPHKIENLLYDDDAARAYVMNSNHHRSGIDFD